MLGDLFTVQLQVGPQKSVFTRKRLLGKDDVTDIDQSMAEIDIVDETLDRRPHSGSIGILGQDHGDQRRQSGS